MAVVHKNSPTAISSPFETTQGGTLLSPPPPFMAGEQGAVIYIDKIGLKDAQTNYVDPFLTISVVCMFPYLILFLLINLFIYLFGYFVFVYFYLSIYVSVVFMCLCIDIFIVLYWLCYFVMMANAS